jgi:hypothetical protein
MTCSNNIICPDGLSSYSSNFTFSQNEADPWSPNYANEPDSWVAQEQHVSLPSCKKFSVVSDGTRGGTMAEGEGRDDRGICMKVKHTTTGLLGGGGGKKTSSKVRIQAVVTSRPKVVQNITGSRSVSRGTIALTILLAFFILLPGVHVSPN